MAKTPHLGEAELEIMQILWSAEEAVTSTWIHERIKVSRSWPLSTLMYSLSRLCDKGFASCDKSGGMNRYTPLVSQSAYQQEEGRSFLQKLYGNSLSGLVLSLYDGKAVSRADLDELRALLDELEGDEAHD